MKRVDNRVADGEVFDPDDVVLVKPVERARLIEVAKTSTPNQTVASLGDTATRLNARRNQPVVALDRQARTAS